MKCTVKRNKKLRSHKTGGLFLILCLTKQCVETYCDFFISGPVVVMIWTYNYLCSQCLSSLTLWVWILLRRSVLNTTLCDKVCQWLVTDQWFSQCALVSSTKKTDRHYITEILLKVVLNTITLTLTSFSLHRGCNGFACWPCVW